MTQLETYKCDRCGKLFQKEVQQLPSKITVEDNDFGTNVDSKHLCADCLGTYYCFIEYVKAFDSFANKLSESKGE